jgi:hypothetical protein
VAEYHRRNAGGWRIAFEVSDVVEDMDQEFAEFDDLRRRQRRRPCSGVHIAANCRNRCDLGQPGDNFGFADIAGVDNAIAAPPEPAVE